MKATKQKPEPPKGRPSSKADMIPMRLMKPLEKYLRKQSKKEKKTMTAFVEELLEFRRKFKTLPTA